MTTDTVPLMLSRDLMKRLMTHCKTNKLDPDALCDRVIDREITLATYTGRGQTLGHAERLRGVA